MYRYRSRSICILHAKGVPKKDWFSFKNIFRELSVAHFSVAFFQSYSQIFETWRNSDIIDTSWGSWDIFLESVHPHSPNLFLEPKNIRFSPRDCITFHPIWHLHFASFNNTKFLWPFGMNLGNRREGKSANREIFLGWEKLPINYQILHDFVQQEYRSTCVTIMKKIVSTQRPWWSFMV